MRLREDRVDHASRDATCPDHEIFETDSRNRILTQGTGEPEDNRNCSLSFYAIMTIRRHDRRGFDCALLGQLHAARNAGRCYGEWSIRR